MKRFAYASYGLRLRPKARKRGILPLINPCYGLPARLLALRALDKETVPHYKKLWGTVTLFSGALWLWCPGPGDPQKTGGCVTGVKMITLSLKRELGRETI